MNANVFDPGLLLDGGLYKLVTKQCLSGIPTNLVSDVYHDMGLQSDSRLSRAQISFQ